MTVKQLAGSFDLNPDALRHYTKLGLVRAHRHGENDYRMYGTAERNRLRFLFSVLILVSSTATSADSEPNAVLEEDQAIEIAVHANPNLAEMRARYEALSEVPAQAGSLPDPTLSLNAMNFPTDTFDRSQEPMTQLQFGVSQKFPFPGKLGLRQEAAEHDAMAAAHSVEELRLKLIKNVKIKWWETLYLDRALVTVGNNQTLLRQFITVAKTKYETGTGLQQDVLLAQLELSKLIDQQIQIEAVRRTQAIKLNILMDRSPADDVTLPAEVPAVMPDLVNDIELYRRAENSRPLLGRMETQIDAARSRLNLAKREYYPDFMVGVTYGDRIGDNPPFMGGTRADFFSLMLSANVPLYANRKQSRAVAQRTSELQKSQFALQDKKGTVLEAIASAVTEYGRAREQFELFRSGIIPQARQTVQSMLAGYQVSEVDFLNLVRSQVTLFNYELRYWKVFVEAKIALAKLAAAVGEESVHE